MSDNPAIDAIKKDITENDVVLFMKGTPMFPQCGFSATVPQLYVKGEFVGGCDIVREMAQSGELEQLFKDKAVATAA